MGHLTFWVAKIDTTSRPAPRLFSYIISYLVSYRKETSDQFDTAYCISYFPFPNNCLRSLRTKKNPARCRASRWMKRSTTEVLRQRRTPWPQFYSPLFYSYYFFSDR